MTDHSGVFLKPHEGRIYRMGPITAIFKAGNDETGGKYDISEWWLDPHTQGPNTHSHPKEDTFYVLAGTMTFLLGTEWQEAPQGSFVLIPGGVTHTFENRSDARAVMLSFGVPGGFEASMPAIVEWFINNPPGRA